MSEAGARNIHAPCEKRFSELEKKFEAALAEIAELRERLNQNSQNSSKPPSSDPPNAPLRPGKRRTGRKPGGQPGHPAHFRALVPDEKVIAVPVKPDECNNCGHPLTGSDSNPLLHQVVEVPKVEPEVTEYQLHCLTCPKCKHKTLAQLPDGVPTGHFGPRLIASVAFLSGAFRLSKRLVQNLVCELLGVEMSLGSIIACERAASHSLAEPVEKAREYVKKQGVKHADESSWFEGATRAKVWLWVATTQLVTVFLIRASRGTEVAHEMLGSVLGVLVSDRWCAYNWWPLEWRQLCWSHIKRHFQAFEDAGGKAGAIGTALLVEEKNLFHDWHRVRDGTLQRSTFRKYVARIRWRVQTLLEQGSRCNHSKTAGTCRELLKLEPAMWTFARIAGVEPTNNSGERAIRPGVIWRKLCFGTHSVEGSRFVERMLSVVYSLKQQKRNALDFVTACVQASLNDRKPESLLPATT
jgi:transposase